MKIVLIKNKETTITLEQETIQVIQERVIEVKRTPEDISIKSNGKPVHYPAILGLEEQIIFLWALKIIKNPNAEKPKVNTKTFNLFEEMTKELIILPTKQMPNFNSWLGKEIYKAKTINRISWILKAKDEEETRAILLNYNWEQLKKRCERPILLPFCNKSKSDWRKMER